MQKEEFLIENRISGDFYLVERTGSIWITVEVGIHGQGRYR